MIFYFCGILSWTHLIIEVSNGLKSINNTRRLETNYRSGNLYSQLKQNGMAEINSSVGGHKKGPGVKKGKKFSTRVDLTPMVDLGFLLITFFIFTTTMSQTTTMILILPKDVPEKDRLEVKLSAVITILPATNDQVYYYEGDAPTKLKVSNFRNIRNVLLDKKRKTDPAYFQVILKPTQDATYKNTVDILDEMTIDAITHFALVDISPIEYKIIQATEHALQAGKN
jgi:biopolymer transport protein ExbD